MEKKGWLRMAVWRAKVRAKYGTIEPGMARIDISPDSSETEANDEPPPLTLLPPADGSPKDLPNVAPMVPINAATLNYSGSGT